MRSYKSIERPAQVLGMNLPDLGLVVGLFLAAVLAIGVAGLVVTVPPAPPRRRSPGASS